VLWYPMKAHGITPLKGFTLATSGYGQKQRLLSESPHERNRLLTLTFRSREARVGLLVHMSLLRPKSPAWFAIHRQRLLGHWLMRSKDVTRTDCQSLLPRQSAKSLREPLMGHQASQHFP
jgi:hypothetical protein